MKKIIAALTLSLLSAGAMAADEGDIALKEGPHKDLVATYCAICHSTDLIIINSVFLDKAHWQTEVNKMIHVMGAPISVEDAQKISEYLTKYYGKKD